MSVSKKPQLLPRNLLLAALPARHYQRLLFNLETVTLTLKEPLYEPDKPIEHAYFPCSGVMSLLVQLEDGSAVELATVGKEGMVGLPLFLGAEKTSGMAFVQIAGDALKIKAQVFKKEVSGNGPLTALLHRYTQAMMVQISQTSACNRFHFIEKRCARWLLMTHDRVGTDEFPLTQEFLSQMLGVRRASVSETASALQKAGLIRYRRGKMTIVNRKGLENASCECYRVVKEEYDQLLS